MKALASVIAVSLALASCAPPNVPGPGGTASTGTIGQQIIATAGDVIAGVQQVCGYPLAIQTAEDILATFVPGTAILGVITKGVCNAVQKKAVRRGGARPVYRGVPL